MLTRSLSRRQVLGQLLSGTAVCMAHWSSLASAQDKPKPGYRNIIRKKLPAEVQAIALEYTIKLVKPGKETPVDPETHQFAVGDKFVITVQPQDDVYIYIFNEGPKGDKACLLPDRERNEEAPFMKAGAKIELPSDGTFEFTLPAGDEKFVVLASKEKLADLDQIVKQAFGKDGAQLPNSPDLKAFETRLKTTENDKLSAAKSRGVLDDSGVDKFVKDVYSKKRGVYEEAPTKDNNSTFAMAVAAPNTKAELLVRIALKTKK